MFSSRSSWCTSKPIILYNVFSDQALLGGKWIKGRRLTQSNWHVLSHNAPLLSEKWRLFMKQKGLWIGNLFICVIQNPQIFKRVVPYVADTSSVFSTKAAAPQKTINKGQNPHHLWADLSQICSQLFDAKISCLYVSFYTYSH